METPAPDEPDTAVSKIPDMLVSEIPDLSTVGFAALEIPDGSPLGQAIARLLAEAARPDEAVAGFNSSI
jgi:FXSXX-COOH protein